MIEISNNNKNTRKTPYILVAGIGGGGNNAINRMISAGIENVHFLAINTDYDVLEESKAESTLQIGYKLTSGFGAGADPKIGEAAAFESEDDIRNAVAESNMVILTCGLGGGTGTGAVPVVAKICKDLGILTVAVVTLPFSFESGPRKISAEAGLDTLKKNVDTLLVIPNEKLLNISDKQLDLEDAFLIADDVLKCTIQGITNIIFNKGTVNLDFNDLNTLLRGKGLAHLGIGIIDEGKPMMDAIQQAVNSPLLDTNIREAATLLINTSGKVKLNELNEAISYIQGLTGNETNILWGTVTDKNTTDNGKIVVTLIATGLKEEANPENAEAATIRVSPESAPSKIVSKRMPLQNETGIIIPPFIMGRSEPKAYIPDFLRDYGK